MGRPRKLSDAEVQEIICASALLARAMENYAPAALALKYGVTPGLIYRIAKYGRNYRDHWRKARRYLARAPTPSHSSPPSAHP